MSVSLVILMNSCRDCGKKLPAYFLCGLCYYKRIRDGKSTYFGNSQD